MSYGDGTFIRVQSNLRLLGATEAFNQYVGEKQEYTLMKKTSAVQAENTLCTMKAYRNLGWSTLTGFLMFSILSASHKGKHCDCMSHNMRKPFFGDSDQDRHKPACTFTEKG